MTDEKKRAAVGVASTSALVRSICGRCGNELPLWFDPTATSTYPDDDTAFRAWLQTPCPYCDTTPRDNGHH
jgi:hypothetical protein